MGIGTGGTDGESGAGQGNPDARSILLVLQTSQPTLETFQDLLHRHPDAFYLARTAKALQAHWQLMKQYYLLEDQTGNWAQDLAEWRCVCMSVDRSGCSHPQVPCNKSSVVPRILFTSFCSKNYFLSEGLDAAALKCLVKNPQWFPGSCSPFFAAKTTSFQREEAWLEWS